MIAVDTNILVYAHRRDSSWHLAASDRLRSIAESPAPWLIPWPCIHEFISIVTHPRIYSPPSSIDAAVRQVEFWMESPSLVLGAEDRDYWQSLRSCIIDAKVAGPAVHDARVAMICKVHGVTTLWTADRDFSRFSGVRTANPLIAPP